MTRREARNRLVIGLAMIEAFGRALTKRQREVLRLMRDRECACPGCDGAELVYDRGRGFLDDAPVSGRTVFALLRACAISRDDVVGVGDVERYRINETGRNLVAVKP